MNLNQNNEIINDMNIMNMNNFQPMMFNQFNNNLNKDELMINLINQNSQMTNQIAINNNILKSLMQNPMKSKLDLSEINFFPRYKESIRSKKLILKSFSLICTFFLEIIDKNSSVKVSGILYKSMGLYDCKKIYTKD